MGIFAQQLINGLTLGSIYGLIAIGYSMVFGIIGMVNFAHGDVFMLSAFIALILFLIVTSLLGISSVALALLIVLIGAILLTALWGWAVERTAYKPLRGSFRLAPLISAIGVSIFLSNFVRVIQDPNGKNLPDAAQIHGVHTLFEQNGFAVTVANKHLMIWATTLIVLVVFRYIVRNTALGRAQRACEQDRRMAALMGINTDRTIALTFVFGAGLAAVAGVMHLLNYSNVTFADGFVPGIKAFTAAVLGGIGSLPGAVLGGLIIAFIEVFWSNYVGVAYKDVAAFSVLAIVLIFMPSGILGRPEIEKV